MTRREALSLLCVAPFAVKATPAQPQTITIQAFDARSFEVFLKSGGASAILRTLPQAIRPTS